MSGAPVPLREPSNAAPSVHLLLGRLALWAREAAALDADREHVVVSARERRQHAPKRRHPLDADRGDEGAHDGRHEDAVAVRVGQAAPQASDAEHEARGR
eukprot:6955129-Prymnesium_polylepis.1